MATWRRLETTGMPLVPRSSHSATLFGDDEILLYGGYGGDTPESCEARSDFLSLALPPLGARPGGAEDAAETAAVVSAYTPVDRATARVGHAALRLDGNLYVFGGFDGVVQYLGGGFLFDVEAEHVLLEKQQARTLPPGRRDHTLTAVGRKVVLFGGWNMAEQFNDVWALDKYDWRWRQVDCAGDEAPCPRRGHTAVRVGTRVYVFGGIYGLSRYLGDTHVLDTGTWTWSRPALAGDSPSARAWHSAVPLGASGRILVYGGTAGRVNFHGDAFVLHTEAGRWEHVALAPQSPVPAARCSHAAVAVDGGARLVVVGGIAPSRLQGSVVPLDDVWVLDGLGAPEPGADADADADAAAGPAAADAAASAAAAGEQFGDEGGDAETTLEGDTAGTMLHDRAVGGTAFHPPASVRPATAGQESLAVSDTTNRPVEGWLAIRAAIAAGDGHGGDGGGGGGGNGGGGGGGGGGVGGGGGGGGADGAAPTHGWVRRYFQLSPQDGLRQYEHRAKGSTVVADGAVRLFREHARHLFAADDGADAEGTVGATDVEDLLNPPCEDFLQYLRSVYALENADLYLEVAKFRAAPQPEQPAIAQFIWSEFIAPEAPRGIQINHAARDQVREAILSGNVTADLFDRARRRVLFILSDTHLPGYTEHLMQAGSGTRHVKTALTEADRERAECDSCLGRFNFHRRRNFCRLCGAVVCGGCLSPLQTPARLGFGPGPHRACDMCRCAVQRPQQVDRAFKLQSQHRSRPLNLYADTDEEAAQWVEALRSALAGGEGHLEGWLTKEDPTSKEWRRRYVVLHGTRLWYLQLSRQATYSLQHGGIHSFSAVEPTLTEPRARAGSTDAGASPCLRGGFRVGSDFSYRFSVSTSQDLHHLACETEAERLMWIEALHRVLAANKAAEEAKEAAAAAGAARPTPPSPALTSASAAGTPSRPLPRKVPPSPSSGASASGLAAALAARADAGQPPGGGGGGGGGAVTGAGAGAGAAAAGAGAAPEGADAAGEGDGDGVPPPTGEVALVVAVVDDQATMWERCPGEFNTALHDVGAMVSGEVRRFGGYLTEWEQGRFAFAFGSAADATLLAATLHVALERVEWPPELPEGGLRLRVGVHVGEPRCEWNAVSSRMAYSGPAMEQAVAVADAAHGGQTLATSGAREQVEAAREEARDADGGDAARLVALDVRNAGLLRLPGDPAPSVIYEVVPPELSARAFPAFPRRAGDGNDAAAPAFSDDDSDDEPPPPPP